MLDSLLAFCFRKAYNLLSFERFLFENLETIPRSIYLELLIIGVVL